MLSASVDPAFSGIGRPRPPDSTQQGSSHDPSHSPPSIRRPRLGEPAYALGTDGVSLPLVVLAAGLSTRFGRLKQLHPIGPSGESILDYNVFDAARAGFDRVLFVVRPEIEDRVRAHVERMVGDALPVEFVSQELSFLPDGFRAPPDRARPWGTGQAVILAAQRLGEPVPFGVCNADDLYGPGAFEILRHHMGSEPPPSRSALVGYRLADTLTGSGEVARGVCVLRREGTLERITEVRNIHRKDGWVTGTEVDGEPVELTGNETVSMNLWGFVPSVVQALERQFRRFLELWGTDTQHEFFLSTAISNQIRLSSSTVHVYHAPDPWFGMTHTADHERTQAALRSRIAAGTYPQELRRGFLDLAVR